ncbi:hypothetical protein D3C81_1908070 [compost metagenome]
MPSPLAPPLAMLRLPPRRRSMLSLPKLRLAPASRRSGAFGVTGEPVGSPWARSRPMPPTVPMKRASPRFSLTSWPLPPLTMSR